MVAHPTAAGAAVRAGGWHAGAAATAWGCAGAHGWSSVPVGVDVAAAVAHVLTCALILGIGGSLRRSRNGQAAGRALLHDADRTRLAQALGEPPSRAGKLAPPGGPIAVSMALDDVVPERPPAAPSPADADLGVPATDPPRRVLIVDDNRDAAAMLAMLVGSLGHAVQTAFDGEQALARAEAFRPEAVLLDIGLPVVDGHEVCRRLRHLPWAAGVTIVALTGWGQPEDRRRSLDAGFDAHLVKPADLDDIRMLITGAAAMDAPSAAG